MAEKQSSTEDRSEELPAGRVGEVAVEEIARLTSKETDGVTSVEPIDDGWRVEVEVVEETRIPSSADMLGTYRVDLDMTGELLSYRRVRRYSRGQANGGRTE